jgi:hypothetical protein
MLRSDASDLCISGDEKNLKPVAGNFKLNSKSIIFTKISIDEKPVMSFPVDRSHNFLPASC